MSNSNESYAPRVKVGRVYQRKSASGATYFAGRLGAAKLVIVKAKEPAENGTPVCARARRGVRGWREYGTSFLRNTRAHARVMGCEFGVNLRRVWTPVRTRASWGSSESRDKKGIQPCDSTRSNARPAPAPAIPASARLSRTAGVQIMGD